MFAMEENEMPQIAQHQSPIQTIKRLLPAVKQEALARGKRDPIWDVVNRAESLVSRKNTEDNFAAITIADWMTVRFG